MRRSGVAEFLDEAELNAQGHTNLEKRKYDIIDQYIRDLGDQGISIKELRLLGEGDYTSWDNVEQLLTDPALTENKNMIRKYIGEFIRADIITQQTHKRSAKLPLVKESNQDHVDGGIYIYRSTQDSVLNLDAWTGPEYHEAILETDPTVKLVEYMPEQEFKDELGITGSLSAMNGQSVSASSKSKAQKLKYKYTIDTQTGDLIFVGLKSVETKSTSSVWDTSKTSGAKEIINWFNSGASGTYEVTIMARDYKALISKYAMPYEFLINLCEITQNPEFVYHVALLARDTQIDLIIQDDIAIDVEMQQELVTGVKNYSYAQDAAKTDDTPTIAGSSESNAADTMSKSGTKTTEETPNLRVKLADTWSFYEVFDFMKQIDGSYEETTSSRDLPAATDSDLQYSHSDSMGVYNYYTASGGGKVETTNSLVTVTAVYDEEGIPRPENCEKSKQFLGLLRNDDGDCPIDCYETTGLKYKNPKAIECVHKATFNIDGTNVKYIIPNSTEEESPLNKLQSGIEMLYAAMQSNSSGYQSKESVAANGRTSTYTMQTEYYADQDYESMYIEKLDGLVEHVRYLMTFPENEDYDPYDMGEDTYDDGEEEERPKLDYGDVQLDEDDITLLAQMLYGEDRSGNFTTQAHVISVAMNRLLSSRFPNTIPELMIPSQFNGITYGKQMWPQLEANGVADQYRDIVRRAIAQGDTAQGALFFDSAVGGVHPHSRNPAYKKLFENAVGHWFYTYADGNDGLPRTGGGSDRNDEVVVVGNIVYVNGVAFMDIKQPAGSSYCSLYSMASLLSAYDSKYTPQYLFDLGCWAWIQRGNSGFYGMYWWPALNDAGLSATISNTQNDLSWKDRVRNGSKAIVGVRAGAGRSGQSWTNSTHYMTVAGYRNVNGEEQIYVINPGTSAASKNGWISINEWDNICNQSIVVDF